MHDKKVREPGGTQQIGWADTSIQTFTRFFFSEFPIVFITTEYLEITINDWLEEWHHKTCQNTLVSTWWSTCRKNRRKCAQKKKIAENRGAFSDQNQRKSDHGGTTRMDRNEP